MVLCVAACVAVCCSVCENGTSEHTSSMQTDAFGADLSDCQLVSCVGLFRLILVSFVGLFWLI